MGDAPSPNDRGSLLAAAFEISREGLARVEDGIVGLASSRLGALCGFPDGIPPGLAAVDLVAPEDRARMAGWLDLADSRLTLEVSPARVLEAEKLELAWRALPGDPPGSGWLLALDATPRLEAERKAREQSELFERIARLAPYFLFVFDYEQNRDVYINRPVPQALGYSDEEARALGPYPFLALCHRDDLERALDRDERWRDLSPEAIQSVEFRLRHRTGEWRWFRSYNLAFERNAEGRVVKILGLSEDITERKRAAEILRQNDRLETFGLMAAGIAHDLGNLLTPLVAHSELLLAELGDSTEARRHAQALSRSVARARQLVEQLFLIAGRGENPLAPVDLNRVVEESVSLVEDRSQVPPITLDLSPELPRVPGDSSQLGQVVFNLLGNACDALAGRSGRIEVRTQPIVLEDRDQIGPILLGERLEPGPVVILEVADQGVGMDEETQARLFEPFFTTKSSGRGLGMAATMGILRRHGAGVQVESAPGKGSRFRLFFPATLSCG